jgi:hypothetical protein
LRRHEKATAYVGVHLQRATFPIGHHAMATPQPMPEGQRVWALVKLAGSEAGRGVCGERTSICRINRS